jgi:hypothetical protein
MVHIAADVDIDEILWIQMRVSETGEELSIQDAHQQIMSAVTTAVRDVATAHAMHGQARTLNIEVARVW